MKLGSSRKLRFGLLGAGIGVFGTLLTMVALSDIKTSSAAEGGLVSVATVDTAVGFEMNSSMFEINAGATSATSSGPRAISVYTNAPSGLSFKIGSASNSLVYKSAGSVSDTFTAVSGSTTLANMTNGTWGYAAATGSSCGTTFKGVPTTATNLISASTFPSAGTYNVSLCVAARGSVSKAEGTYAGQFTLSVAVNSAPVRYSVVYLDPDDSGGASVLGTDSAYESTSSHNFTLNNTYTKEGYELVGWKLDNAGSALNPGDSITAQSSDPTARYFAVWEQHLTLADISTMQEMTSAVCADTATPLASDGASTPQYQLEDTRDNKLYWVAKLADGNCWMTQNLDLDITAAGLDSTTSDIGYTNGAYPTSTVSWNSSSPRPPVATLTDASQYNNSNATSTASWDAGNWYYDGTTISDCGSKKTTYEGCTGFSNTGNAHRHVGNMYSWGAATAGSGGAITSGQAQDSICPKGWHLPMSSGNPSFANLQTAGSLGSTVQNWLNAPYYFTRTGILWYYSDKFDDAGDGGYYWSSTANSYAYALYFHDSSAVDPAYYHRAQGMSVRCVAR